MSGLRVGRSSIHGRGVFAERAFAAGELIERCEVLRIPRSEREAVKSTVLFEFLFGFDDGSGDVGLALGYGSLYNHSENANAEYTKDAENSSIVIRAVRDIAPSEEVTVKYQNVWRMPGRRGDTGDRGAPPRSGSARPD